MPLSGYRRIVRGLASGGTPPRDDKSGSIANLSCLPNL
jgi:hypothetical protein